MVIVVKVVVSGVIVVVIGVIKSGRQRSESGEGSMVDRNGLVIRRRHSKSPLPASSSFSSSSSSSRRRLRRPVSSIQDRNVLLFFPMGDFHRQPYRPRVKLLVLSWAFVVVLFFLFSFLFIVFLLIRKWERKTKKEAVASFLAPSWRSQGHFPVKDTKQML